MDSFLEEETESGIISLGTKLKHLVRNLCAPKVILQLTNWLTDDGMDTDEHATEEMRLNTPNSQLCNLLFEAMQKILRLV